MQSVRRSVELLLAVAVVFHVGVMFAAKARTGAFDGYAFNSLDSGEYFRIARNLAEHGAFSQGEGPALALDTWRTPGYPAFLAAVMVVAGPSPVAAIIAQKILAVLSVWLLFRIVRRWMSTRRALLVSFLFLLEPYHAFYSLWLMAETLFVVVLLLAWYCWQRALETARWHWFALTGASAGYAVLVRPVGALVPVALLVGSLWVALRSRRSVLGDATATRIPWPSVGAYSVAAAAILGGWMGRNHTVAGRFALSDQGGVVLAYFKAAEVELWRDGRTADRYLETSLDPARADEPHAVWERIDARLRDQFASVDPSVRETLRWPNLAQGNRTAVDSFAVGAALARIGRSMLLADPLSTAAACLTRCADLLAFPLSLAIQPPTGVQVNRLTSVGKGVGYAFLALLVLIRLSRRALPFAQVYFPLACTAALLLATTPQLDPRFRVPMIPMLLFLAFLPARDREEGKIDVERPSEVDEPVA